MKKLPIWTRPATLPAFHDGESASVIEQTYKLYQAMQELIDDYNTFAESVNKKISDHELNCEQDNEVFQTALRQEFRDFIDVVDLKLKEIKAYTTPNVELSKQVNELKALSQELKDIVLNEFNKRLLAVEDQVSSLSNSEIAVKDIIKQEVKRTKVINAKNNGVLSFAYMTDIHDHPVYRREYKYHILNLLAKTRTLDFICCGGDMLGYDTKDEVIDKVSDYNEIILNGHNVPYFLCKGNHDGVGNIYTSEDRSNILSSEEWYRIGCGFLDNECKHDKYNKYGGYYYRDFENAKIRVINLNTSQLTSKNLFNPNDFNRKQDLIDYTFENDTFNLISSVDGQYINYVYDLGKGTPYCINYSSYEFTQNGTIRILIEESDDKVNWSSYRSFDPTSDDLSAYFNNLTANKRYIKIEFYLSSDDSISFKDFQIETRNTPSSYQTNNYWIDPMDVIIQQNQVDWLSREALNFSDKGDDKVNWSVIIISHASINVLESGGLNGQEVLEGILKAYMDGTTYTGTQHSGTFMEITANVDFTNQGKMEFIGAVCGHMHYDRITTFNSLNRPNISVGCAKFEMDTTTNEGAFVPERVDEEITEELADLISIDTSNRKIKLTRFGAGVNREVSY